MQIAICTAVSITSAEPKGTELNQASIMPFVAVQDGRNGFFPIKL